ncbi:hypothetical protein [Treponema sp.]|uniref:hypothetical protein n=1 Tax=Treponema sp. TaxID=166 RepID=UPI003EFD8F97
MKLKKKIALMGKLLFLTFAIIFSGCKEKNVPSIKVASDDSIEIQPRESSSELKENSWTDENGIVCVLIGYGFNDNDFVKKAINSLDKKFGLAENGGLVLPLVFPDDLHCRISSLRDVIEKNNVHGIVLLGAPENTHSPLARIKEEWNGNPPFNVFSIFPQDDVLGQEFTCNFVIDHEYTAGIQFGDTENKNEDDETLALLISSVEYAAELPFVLPQDSELYYHVQAVAGKRKVARYVDSETGIQSRNHFIILNSAE